MSFVPTSLRTRLLLAAVAVGTVFAVLFGALAAWRVHHAESQAISAALQSRVELARDEVAADGSLVQDAGSPKTDLVQVLGPDGAVRAGSPALHGVPPLADVTAVVRSRAGVESRTLLRQPDIDLAVLAVPLRLRAYDGSPAGTGALVVATDIEGFRAATSDLLGLLLTGLALLVLAIGALAWVLIGRALGSVAQLTENAESVRPRDLQAGLPIPHRDAELTRLVEALNRMLARLHDNHLTELAFAADASHRLRTPVATLRAEAELALRESDPEELTAALRRVVQDADQLTSVVDRMLARSRSHGDAPPPVLATLAEASPRWHRQASLRGVDLLIEVGDGIDPEARCAELLTVVDPVVDNAVRHTPVTGQVVVTVDLSRDGIVVHVSNDGEPIPEQLAPHVFDAWVSTRDASVAGGLGLWLARETARDVGGDVELMTAGHSGSQTTFRARLPFTP